MTKADYFSLGNRNDSYTSIALHVAQYEEYRRPMIDHLYQTKLRHWDPTIRALAAKALGGLAKMDMGHMQQNVIPYLLENSLDPRSVQLRHGATIGLADIIVSVGELRANGKPLNELLPEAMLASISELVPTIEKNRLYRGKGGEQMRAAVCRLIECISIAELPMTVPQQVIRFLSE